MRYFAALLVICNLLYFLWHNSLWHKGAFTQVGGMDKSSLNHRDNHTTGDSKQELRLLSELNAQELRALSAVSDPGRHPLGSYCVSLGVFANEDDGNTFLQRLEPFGLDAAVAVFQVNQKPDYWVHLPPFPSQKAALRKLKELKAKNADGAKARWKSAEEVCDGCHADFRDE